MNRDAMRTTLRVTKALSDLQRVRVLMMLRPGAKVVVQTPESKAQSEKVVASTDKPQAKP